MMIRLLAYGLFFPFVGLMAFLFWGSGIAGIADVYPSELLGLLLVAYILEIVPALLTGVVDEVLARRGIRFRWVWCMVAGALLAPLPPHALFQGRLTIPSFALYAAFGAFAAMCSWLIAECFSPRAALRRVLR
jgi:hypothetical protein